MPSYTLVDSKFMTVIEKQKLYDTLTRFIRKGCKPVDFTEYLYKHVMQMFQHIAHYNRQGFIDEWFNSAADRYRFLKHIMAAPCYGDPTYTRSDVEKAMKAYLIEHIELLDLASKDAQFENVDTAIQAVTQIYQGADDQTKEKLRKIVLGG